ncbi:MAG: methionyl-tRNA formyltransferase [Novosphingobium sp. 16-62-11]|uniref:methionyl-tRNA formyltransferase n=1 Tax=Novosphingobium sp. 17-62-19 TaxID=1970406 RepID=UPI000BCE4002|nr:methionyl-tRNA formyltransferase [Novosphingobium sp. 17-62-19]OYX95333.1 MAG: methionyl-tRNA formyltransferase [Novosphingobium sp. 35-62-5]OYZ44974.1 MAG: methionyl-tRNA formyltransferase [Novosphingobium sp. 16-62-11]OZA72284.1 MAG: methionyl-tRNA formyltransferase [Sphingomonadales bacterium 39-62-4]HQS95542.1 methionyl-tRNA formyltransferase [Novosphingobium sp.]OZA20457.1 MAG: methionyl-tRNA formyltransferase [Novosphingobium sp. 17-62-19]
MRIIFMGTPQFAVPTLEALVAAGHDVVAAYSQPPRAAGRGKKLQPSSVHLAAEAHGIEVRTPVSLKDADEQAAFAALEADVAVVAAYGLILPQAVLDAPKLGCLNVHGSLLPRWRGAAPVQRAILAGDALTGVTIMQMERGLDTGPMLATVETPVDGKTAGDLTTELAEKGAALMVSVLADLGTYPPVVQPDDGVTYAHKIDKAESRLDFARDAVDVERQVRAFAPSPGAFFELEGERYRVLAAEVIGASGTAGETLDDALTIACGQGAIRPTLVQRAGRPAMDAAALLRGRAIAAGIRLS